MRVIVAGSRQIMDLGLVEAAIKESGFEITEVISGGARGVDLLGELWAIRNSKEIKRFPANWDANGKAAGPIRNGLMAEYGEALVAVWDGTSPGTKDMIAKAQAKGLKVYVKVV